ncbi:phosphotransferase enzyme family protein [Sporosalibacterium faouarense]|uniref:phosphotransferase enzyme family protein n=1 Tax=Sporosalibacterium faouarense TaxID=516123 RepID=UPI00192B6C76|nr:phosphotransferase [Sporosalibacterium faouarense]
MIVKNWEYDDLDLFKYWRISSNAIYPFRNKENVYYLRFSPVDEKNKDEIIAELEFLQYLKDSKYNAIETRLSINNKKLEVVETPWGRYNSVVFKRVKGESLGEMELTDEIVLLWGKALGQLHRLSEKYKPSKKKRCNWEDKLDLIEKILSEFPEEKQGLKEAKILREKLASLPITEENYGLIHYDFELDNIFYNKSNNEIIPIDFDDSMYHWYMMDIERSINSIKSEVDPKKVDKFVELFIEGYSSEKSIQSSLLELIEVFERFGNLYGYARVLRASKERWKNEPEWLENLRKHLNRLLDERSKFFGLPIN